MEETYYIILDSNSLFLMDETVKLWTDDPLAEKVIRFGSKISAQKFITKNSLDATVFQVNRITTVRNVGKSFYNIPVGGVL